MTDSRSSATSKPGVHASVSRLGRLTLKELRETLRDRRTILTLLLMPVLLYPLLTISFQRFVLSSASNLRVEYILAIDSAETEPVIVQCLSIAEQRRRELQRRENQGKPLKPLLAPTVRYLITPHLEREVRDAHVDLGIRLRPGRPATLDPARDVAVDIELVYLPGNKFGERALAHVEGLLKDASDALLRFRLRHLGLQQRPNPVRTTAVSLRDPEEAQNQMLASIIPVILILMTITGAVYPAIDLTAGERERGTLEMLVAAPVPRLGLLFAKYVAVLTVAFLTAAINLVSMTITIIASGLGPILFGDKGISPVTVLEIFGLMILFASFFSALLLTLTSFARSFKEAQAYLIPLMLVSLGPGLVGLMPGIRLSGALLIVPLLNVVLLSRDLLQGQHALLPTVIVITSTLLYALAALAVAARIFGTHVVLYESQTAWADLFRRPAEPQSAPRVESAMLCLALLFPVCFILKGALGLLAGGEIELQLLLTGLSSLVAFIGLPIWAAHAGHVPSSLAFAWRRPKVLAVVGAMVCGISLWPFAHEIVVGLSELGLVPLDESQLKLAKELIERCRNAPLILVLLTFAVFPAVSEEICFRGYLFRSLQSRLSGWATVFSTGVLFGLFHLVAVDHLAIERLVPTTFLGCILGWIRWKTDSIWPGICMHVCHNGLLTLAFYFEDRLGALSWTVENKSHLPILWLGGAAVLVAIGLSLIQLGARPQQITTDPVATDSMRT